MNKTELIDHIASKADISKAAAGRSLDALIGAVKTTLKKGGTDQDQEGQGAEVPSGQGSEGRRQLMDGTAIAGHRPEAICRQ